MLRFLGSLFSAASSAALFGVAVIAALVHYYGRDLPGHDELVDYQPKLLTRVYAGDGRPMAEYFRERRIFVPISEVPELVKNAFISAEDKNFYEHPGVDAVGIAKALGRYAQARMTGGSARLAGASTISQQVMKNFLLSSDRDYERKIKEAMLAMRLDGALSKDKILELYLNEIYLGARSYGIVAAAQNYFGKSLVDLNVAEAAYLAALPKEPSKLHPVKDHDRALGRRNYVLREMYQNDALDEAGYEAARAEPLDTILDDPAVETVSDTIVPSYFAGEVRRQLIDELGEDDVYEGGLTVRATIDDELQAMAAGALRRGLEKYDRAQGVWRGPSARVEEVGEDWLKTLAATEVPRDIADWSPAVVLSVSDGAATVGIEATGETAELDFATERKWIARARRDPEASSSKPRNAGDIWQPGDVIHVQNVAENGADWRLRQIPEIQGAFMAMDPHSGRVLAMQGGFSRDESVFNRATQALRQPGSSFKPFVYAAALDAGYTPATVVLDAPIVIDAGGREWKPKNSSGNFSGPIPLRNALEWSKNLVTVRLAQEIGMDRIAEYAERFGVYKDMPHHLAYSLGAGETTLYQMVAAYSMFANGGKRVQPTVIDRIQNRNGETLFRHDQRHCEGCEVDVASLGQPPRLYDMRDQIMDPVTAFQLTSMLQGVIKRGTASKTVGGLPFDVAGKTGTTNDNKDAWFIGYTRNMVAGCFMGFDTPRPMGKKAFGGTLCGPIFKEFMAEAMKTRQPGSFDPWADQPDVVMVKIDRFTGERLPDDAFGDNVVIEAFLAGTEPDLYGYNAIAQDNVLFRDYAEDDLPFALSDAPAEQVFDDGSQGAWDRSDLPDYGSQQAPRPQAPSSGSVGLGTGGLY